MQAKLECPKCKKHWADLTFGFTATGNLKPIEHKHFKLVGGKAGAIKKGSEIRCTFCGNPYSYYCMSIAIAESLPTEEGTG